MKTHHLHILVLLESQGSDEEAQGLSVPPYSPGQETSKGPESSNSETGAPKRPQPLPWFGRDINPRLRKLPACVRGAERDGRQEFVQLLPSGDKEGPQGPLHPC